MKFLNNIEINILLEIEMGTTLVDLKKHFRKETFVSNISLNITSLCDKNIIDVVSSDDDKRVKIIYLTEKGYLIKLLYGYIKDLMGVKNGYVC